MDHDTASAGCLLSLQRFQREYVQAGLFNASEQGLPQGSGSSITLCSARGSTTRSLSRGSLSCKRCSGYTVCCVSAACSVSRDYNATAVCSAQGGFPPQTAVHRLELLSEAGCVAERRGQSVCPEACPEGSQAIHICCRFYCQLHVLVLAVGHPALAHVQRCQQGRPHIVCVASPCARQTQAEHCSCTAMTCKAAITLQRAALPACWDRCKD